MKVTDKRKARAAEIEANIIDPDPVQVPEQTTGEGASLGPVLDGLIRKPELGEKFWLHDVQFQVVSAQAAGIVIMPCGISRRAAKAIRKAMHGSATANS